ncbi:helix-turn-helix transcriptional regulator [Agathobaculum sp. Marseille-P7918]|uniref:helix-turn-helix transcriptional regulator n=1 Tax=Agathobaculum sp. Marseille-P7918 TaxID=2479843 RepID=UPI000F62C44C|nr:helix-turn-helix transcriptional regulator [Agathobaculum sp. Marseille-P7918]
MPYTVKQARVLRDFTQAEMAEKMGISRGTYRKIEDNPESATVKQAKQIADITQISINDIFFSNIST